MAKLRHIALTVPDPEKAAKFYIEAFGLKRVGETDWAGASGVYLSDGVMNLALLRYKSEEMAGHRGGGFYEVKYHDPDGIVFDLTESGWAGAEKK
jgi:catechol 2,3-dioxygenase-like lactoylglutathione lyase family enzyme